MLQPDTTTTDLYRMEAVNAKKVPWLGEIVLVRPIAFSFLTLFASVCGACVLVFLFVGSYTKRTTVNGQLLPSNGLVKVYAPQTGVVLERHVKEGDVVVRGQVLYTLSSDRKSSTLGETQAAISQQLQQRRASLNDERRKTAKLHSEDYESLQNRVRSLRRQLEQVIEQISIQERRTQLAKDALSRYEGLLTQRYFSQAHVEAKHAEQLDQTLKLRSLHREQANVSQELSLEEKELKTLPLKQQNQLGKLDRELLAMNQELTESEVRRQFIITAPESGTATAVIAEMGQLADPSRPLASIVPSNSILKADLYAPSRAVGFIRPNDTVLLRYQAYPYQKFGQYKGKIVSVSKTALPVSEVAAISGAMPGFDVARSEQLYYRISVELNSQSLNAYGKTMQLQSGMVLEADILQETRRLYEWVLEPLYSLRGKAYAGP